MPQTAGAGRPIDWAELSNACRYLLAYKLHNFTAQCSAFESIVIDTKKVALLRCMPEICGDTCGAQSEIPPLPEQGPENDLISLCCKVMFHFLCFLDSLSN